MAEECKIDGYIVTEDDFPEGLRDMVDIVGLPAMIALMECMGGELLYIQKLRSIARKARNRQMRREFNGRNYRELAEKNNITERHARGIIDGAAERKAK